MILNLRIVKVNPDYCDYLRKFDNRVTYNKYEKELRPFVGILFVVDNMLYFAPLSSPKEKHKKMKNMIDFFKINQGEYGVINFNNMIPVTEDNYKLIDLSKTSLDKKEIDYQNMLRQQLYWLNANINQINDKAYKLYILYKSKRLPETVVNRCCNFILLEEKCRQYKNED